MNDSLGKAGRNNMMVLVECRLCRRQARFLARDLAIFYGQETEPRSLPFRCETCNTRDCRIEVTANEYGRSHEVVVWRPIKLRQG